jgi:hypothetical protein
MSIAALWSRFSTHQAGIFPAAPVGFADDSLNACGDAAIFVPGCVSHRSRTASPHRSGCRAGNENPSRRGHGLIVNAP